MDYIYIILFFSVLLNILLASYLRQHYKIFGELTKVLKEMIDVTAETNKNFYDILGKIAKIMQDHVEENHNG